MVDYEQAVRLATEGKLTIGEIAHQIGWPEQRSLSSLTKYLEAKLPKPRRIRGIEVAGPVFRTVRRLG